ncbi:MAG: lipase [Phycisphaeraceae bacterium]|nr:MAG: lipase [Phycisphaeraceae bacterium]
MGILSGIGVGLGIAAVACIAGPPEENAGSGLQVCAGRVYATVETPAGELELKLDVLRDPEGDNAPRPAVVFIHGGGMAESDRTSGRWAVEDLARAGYVSVAIDYRLMHQGMFPAPLHDCKAAIRHLREHAAELGIDPERVGVWGHSAGGHLAAMVAVTGPEGAFEEGVPEGAPSGAVQCAVGISGPTDIARLMSDMMGGVPLPGAMQEQMKAASPMTHADGEDPPILIIHGDADDAIAVSHARDFRAALEAAGVVHGYVELEGAGHNIVDRATLERVRAFFDEHLGTDTDEG